MIERKAYVEIDGEEVHGFRKWAAIFGFFLAVLGFYATITAPVWLLALVM